MCIRDRYHTVFFLDGGAAIIFLSLVSALLAGLFACPFPWLFTRLFACFVGLFLSFPVPGMRLGRALAWS